MVTRVRNFTPKGANFWGAKGGIDEVLWKVGWVDLYKFQLKADIRDRREAITRLYWRTPTLLLRITSKATENIHPKFFCKSPKSFFLLLQITSKPTEKHLLANLS